MKLLTLIVKLQKAGHHRFARQLLAQVSDAQLNSPSVIIDPGLGAEIQQAVKELQSVEPNIFKGISKIVALNGGPFGQVSSEDPSVIHINIQKLKQEVKNQIGSQYDPSNQSHNEALQEATKRAIVETIAHESEHSHDFDHETHTFPGGEGVAESKQQQVMQKLYQGRPVEIQANIKLSKFAQRLDQKDGVKEFLKESRLQVSNVSVLRYIGRNLRDRNSFHQEIDKPYLTNLVRRAAEETSTKILPYTGSLLKIIDEVHSKYSAGDLKHLGWYKKMLKVIYKYMSLVEGEWSILLDRVDMVKAGIEKLEEMLPKTQNKSIVDLEQDLGNIDPSLPPFEKAREEKVLRNLILYRIPGTDSKEDLSVLALSPDPKIRNVTRKRLEQLKQTKAAATSGPDYNVTGNEFSAGGTSVNPWETRNRKLLELLKKVKKKKESK